MKEDDNERVHDLSQKKLNKYSRIYHKNFTAENIHKGDGDGGESGQFRNAETIFSDRQFLGNINYEGLNYVLPLYRARSII